ncbi:hypothetical protein BCh11DRAFT_02220 [Burkholderia sp. Ch1-1]|nr:hypothetical protein BCh11DRAFT_02220 [Burkholderia sp. Ch1-1]
MVLAVPLYLQTRYGSILSVSQRSTRPADTDARPTIRSGGPSYKAALFKKRVRLVAERLAAQKASEPMLDTRRDTRLRIRRAGQIA